MSEIAMMNKEQARKAVSRLETIEDVEAVALAEATGKNRTSVLDACEKRMRALQAAAPVAEPEAAEATEATEAAEVTEAAETTETETAEAAAYCPRCKASVVGDEAIKAVFGFRDMKRVKKDGTTVVATKPQSYCRDCRTGVAKEKRQKMKAEKEARKARAEARKAKKAAAAEAAEAAAATEVAEA